MKKVFVTGAPGWLGNRLVGGLCTGLRDYMALPKAKEVRCLVLPGLDTSYLRQFKNVEVVRGDITKPDTIKGSVKGCDTVIHCAGIIHPKKAADFYSINTRGTENVLEEAIKSGVKRFVYVSSNSPAGINISRDILLTEKNPYNPYKHYGKSKMMAEQIVQKAFGEGKIETVIVRPYWFYGEGQPKRQTEFFAMIKKGRPPLFGDGHNLRSMSYIDNAAAGLILAATSKRAMGKTYYIADEKPYEAIEIYRTIAALLKVKELKFIKIPQAACRLFELADDLLQSAGIYSSRIHVAGEMNKNIACSIEKARVELGYNPKVGLYEGMKRSIKWCRENGIKL
jgi:nucleoside-diphosphate-sugar epimerase